MSSLNSLVVQTNLLKWGGKLFLIQDFPYGHKTSETLKGFIENKQRRYFPGFSISEESYYEEFVRHYGLEDKKCTEDDFVKMFESNPYSLLHSHDKDSLSKLLSALGFKIHEAYNYLEKFETSKTITAYVGVIAEKISEPTTDNMLMLKIEAQKLGRLEKVFLLQKPNTIAEGLFDFRKRNAAKEEK